MYVGAVEEMMCVVCECYRGGHSGEGCVLVLTLCKYTLRKGDLFVLDWARRTMNVAGEISLQSF